MDQYRNFHELSQRETEGRDFRVRFEERGEAKTIVIAPHGGSIEPGTSELADAISSRDCHLALFEGIKATGNRDLHITSTNFDHPAFLDLVRRCDYVVAVHGEHSEENTTYIGGADDRLRSFISVALRSAGFDVKIHTSPSLQGESPENICNKGSTNIGVQLELARGLRRALFDSLSATGRLTRTATFAEFVTAVRSGLVSASALEQNAAVDRPKRWCALGSLRASRSSGN